MHICLFLPQIVETALVFRSQSPFMFLHAEESSTLKDGSRQNKKKDKIARYALIKTFVGDVSSNKNREKENETGFVDHHLSSP